MEMKPITISFKKTPEDRELFEWIASHSNFSGFIKDILRSQMKGIPIQSIKNSENTNDKLIDLGDF